MSSNEQNYHIGPQAGSIGQAGGAFSERGRASENAYFHAQEGNINIEPVKPAMNYTSDDSDNHSFKTLVIF
ncbi:unnamed protein product, partial [Adineta steineri]